MKSCVKWFQNQSLRFKMVVLLLAVVLILQVLNGLIFTSIVSKKFEENISESNLATVRQLAINLNQAMEDIVNEMVPIRDEILSQQFLTEGKEPLDNYITQSIIYQELFNQLISADKNYQFINSMLILGSDGQSYSYVLDEYLQLNGENHFQNILKDHRLTKQCQWGGILKDSYFFTQEKEEIISIIMPVYFYGEVKNLLVVNLKLDAVLRYLEELGGLEDTLLLQLSEKDAVFGGRREGQEFTKDEHKFLRNYQESKEMENVDGYVVMSSSLSINQWKLSMITP
ncbi:MAG TPA: cache domain-containing protein, partial [Candidatus Pelethocola excrementipullorum]|nr:cache domain-containing protein [Candidatus Pelethocola excrementipullorum]